MKKRRVLRIKTGEFLLAVHTDRVETTAHIKNALDLNTLSYNTIREITRFLYNAGYRRMTIMEVN